MVRVGTALLVGFALLAPRLGAFQEEAEPQPFENLKVLPLDGLGWGLYRQGREPDAIEIFRRNRDHFRDEYIPNESLADALWFHGEQDAAIRLLEAWLERHPDHDMARRRLNTLRSERQ